MNLFIKIFCCYKNVPYLCVYKRTFFETSIDRIRSFPLKISHKKSCSLAEKKSLTQLRSIPGLK